MNKNKKLSLIIILVAITIIILIIYLLISNHDENIKPVNKESQNKQKTTSNKPETDSNEKKIEENFMAYIHPDKTENIQALGVNLKYENLQGLIEHLHEVTDNNQPAGGNQSYSNLEILKSALIELEIGKKIYIRNIEISKKVDSIISIYGRCSIDGIKDSLYLDKNLNIKPEIKDEIILELGVIAKSYGYKKNKITLNDSRFITTVGSCKKLINERIIDIKG
jgi:hypothetical protein